MDPPQQLRLGVTNCYLVATTEGYLLVDCGSPKSRGSFLAEMNRLGLSISSIRYLFLTHHHIDHSGLLAFLVESNPAIRVVMSEGCAKNLANGRHERAATQRYANRRLAVALRLHWALGGSLPSGFPPYTVRDVDFVCPEHLCDGVSLGETLDEISDEALSETQGEAPGHIPGRIQGEAPGQIPGGTRGGTPGKTLGQTLGFEGQVIYTPGHTEDSISLVAGDHVFVGDAVRNILNFLGNPYEPITHHDKQTCRESWAKILASGAKTICPAHGPPFPSHLLLDALR